MLKSKSKKLVGLCAAIALVSTFSISAFATTGQFSFSLYPDENSGVGYSSFQTKDDNEDIAYITPTSGNLISSDLFYFAVANTSHTRISNYTPFPNNGEIQYNTTIHSSYLSGKNQPGISAALLGDTDRYQVSVTGRWTP